MKSSKLNEVQHKIMALKVCPACGSGNVIRVDHDAICGSCTWNSALLSVNAGELDDLITEYDELCASRDASKESKKKRPLPIPLRSRVVRTA